MTKSLLYVSCRVLLVFFVSLVLVSTDLADAKTLKKRSMEKKITNLMSHDHIPDEIIVKYKSQKISQRVTERLRNRVRAGLKKKFRGQRAMEVIKLRPGVSMRNALDAYLRDPNIEFAEPNYIVYTAMTPNDPGFANQWGLLNTGQTGGTVDADINAPEAWDITTGSENVVIAVIDTGINLDHPDLSGNIWVNTGEIPDNGIDDDGNGYVDDINGWDFVGNDNDPSDLTGHGTLVAGTIAAAGNNAMGISGVMARAQLMPLRALGLTGVGTIAEVIDAIQYANQMGAHVINNSWGVESHGNPSQALKDAIDASGAVVVCAAGNGGDDGVGDDIDFLLSRFYPASYNSANIIAVAATDHNDALTAYSNYGIISVDVGAPGHSIYSTVPQLSFGPPVTVYGEETFDGASGDLPLLGWVRGGTNSTWAVTAGTGTGGSNSLEDSPGASYLSNTESWAGYLMPVTSLKDNLYSLMFSWKGQLENYADAFLINYSLDGVLWNTIDTRYISTGDFVAETIDLYTEIAERFDSFYFGFGIFSGSTVNGDGVYIDKVKLVREPVTVTDFTYSHYSATSMAAAHVSGIAGLVKAFNPSLTNIEIKNAILNSVDPAPSLSGKVLTGGRVNALSALDASCGNLPVQNMVSLVQYSTIQEAYTFAGNGDALRVQSGVFDGDFSAVAGKTVILEGGYDCSYENIIGMTRVNGSAFISDGRITAAGISLQ